MKKIAAFFGVISLALVAYLSLWPVPVEPMVWSAPVAPGSHRASCRQHEARQPEHDLAWQRRGAGAHRYRSRWQTLCGCGQWQHPAHESRRHGAGVFVNTGGRVLGFDFDAAGNLIAADAMKGLLSVAPDRQITVLTDKVGGDPVCYADAVVVAANGKCISPTPRHAFCTEPVGWHLEASVLDILEQQATGRVLEYDPATRGTRVVARGLAFANGIALSKDEQTLFVNGLASTGCGR